MVDNGANIETKGYCIDKLLTRISKNIDARTSQQVKNTACEVVQNCVKVYSQTFGFGNVGLGGSGIVSKLHQSEIPLNGTTGLIYGQVQSGKTLTTISTLAMLSANKFQCFIVLTSDNTWLGKQTASRFRTELEGGPVVFDWEQWRKDPKSFGKSLKDYIQDTGVVLVSTKNIKHLEALREVLNAAQAKAVPGVIFDDEADNASLNTNESKQAKKGKSNVPDSSIFDIIGKIRTTIPNHIYIQITATPQSLLLQSLNHRCKPAFCVLSKPGRDYMGGSLFFDEENSNYCKFFDKSELDILKGGKINPGDSLESIPKGLRLALCCFFLGSMYKMLESDDVSTKYSCLVHICYKKISHENIENVIRYFVVWLDQSLRNKRSQTDRNRAYKYLKEAYQELKNTASNIPDLDRLIDELKYKLRNAIPKVINADNPNKEPGYDCGMNILIGGNRLGRGVTIDGLMVTYYGRDARQKMMDTVHQHARMFGYRTKLKDVTRLFVPEHIFNDFRLIHESDEGMRQVIGDNPNNLPVQPVWVGKDLKPTRSNVLNPSEISAFTPGISTFPRDPMWKKSDIQEHTEVLDSLLREYTEENIYHEVNIDFLIELLSHTPSQPVMGYVWEDRRVREALKSMKKEGICKGRLNVRRGKGQSGLKLKRQELWTRRSFFTSGWIRYAQHNYPDVPTLILGYEKGDKKEGWDNQPLYLPTLVFPKTKFVFMFNYSEEL
ncbi:Z1 domain-containing protein [Baaleninema sp.]|uniref:Z1 domain-containing protein n=1 Tax=Baaleninema sp. TaxID=3101197 RepID=UPI003CFDAD0E